jgi:hypothetical protein
LRELDTERRRAIIRDLQLKLIELMPNVYLSLTRNAAFGSPRIRGFEGLPGPGSGFFHITYANRYWIEA